MFIDAKPAVFASVWYRAIVKHSFLQDKDEIFALNDLWLEMSLTSKIHHLHITHTVGAYNA